MRGLFGCLSSTYHMRSRFLIQFQLTLAHPRMTDLLQRLKHSHRAEPERVKPRFSRKTKCVTVTVFIDAIPMEVSVSIKNLDTTIVRLTDLADGTGPLQMLLEGFLDARQEFGHIIDGKKKTRGRPSRSKEISFKLQYASAWTYCFIRHQWERPIKDRNPFLKKAESRLRRRLRREKCVDSWKTKRYWQIRLLTAFLVGNVLHRGVDPFGGTPPCSGGRRSNASSRPDAR